ncbi:MAG: response regulator [Bacteroidota bacterium]
MTIKSIVKKLDILKFGEFESSVVHNRILGIKNGLYLLGSLFLVSCYANAFNPIQELKSFEIIEKDSAYYPIELIYSFRDSTQKMSFSEITKTHFTNELTNPKNGKGFYWYKFLVTPKIKAKNMLVSSFESDRSDLYVPYKSGYKKYSKGFLERLSEPILDKKYQAAIFFFPTDSIDFSKPFYMVKKTISHFGINSRTRAPEFGLTDKESIAKVLGIYTSPNIKLSFYMGILLISSILFLVGFLVTADKSFLTYCLYLIFTFAIFAIDLPAGFNFINKLNPILYHFVKKASTILASATYLYFAINLLGVKKTMPFLYKVSRLFLLSILCFLAVFIVVLIINPYNEHTISVYQWFRNAFGAISFLLFIIIAVKNGKNKLNAIVLLGSFLLILGNILTIVFDNMYYFLNTVAIETLIFWGLISFKNKINQQKSTSLQYELESERKLMEEQRKLDLAKSNFFANISHEFRTPLTLIATPIQEKLGQDDLSDKERKEYELILRNNNRLATLVNQLLDLSKLESGNLSLKINKISARQFLESQIEPFRYLAENKGLRFEVHFDILQEAIWIDPEAIQKILSNLFTNAIKYNLDNGSVKAYFTSTLDELTLMVKNASEPMTKVQKEQLFNRFYQFNEFKEGAGIGLALVKELVELHKGKIIVENENGFVSFKVILPCEKSSFKASDIYDEIELSSVPGALEMGLTYETDVIDDGIESLDTLPQLLIVEDNHELKAVLQDTFRNEYQITLAADGEEGIRKAMEQIPDIVLSDVMMPKKNGVELTKELKENELTSHIPIILLTAKAGDENELVGVDSGADDYITKPFNNALLKSKMANLLSIRKKMRARYSQEVILKPKDIAVSPPDEILLERIQSVLDTNLIESSFSTEDFAKELGFSRMQLHRKLKGLIGLSATEFIRSQRLKLAAQLLEKSDANVSEVCYQTGFNNLSYFAKCFKEVYGVSPSKYQKSS